MLFVLLAVFFILGAIAVCKIDEYAMSAVKRWIVKALEPDTYSYWHAPKHSYERFG